MKHDNSNELLKEIYQVSFYLDDLRLFLDTHPDDSEALTDYNRMAQHRMALVSDFTEQFGPLDEYDVNIGTGCFKWAETPWPWEGGNY